MSRPSRAAAQKAMTAIADQIEDGQADDLGDPDAAVVNEEESDSSSNDSVSSHDSSSFVKARAPKSQFQIDAEEAVCRGLDLTKKAFGSLRASLKYVYRCLNTSWSMEDFLYKAFDTLHFEERISDANKTLVCELTNTLIKNLDIPYAYIVTTFVPLHEFNGGIYTTLSKAMQKVFGIAILVDLVEQVIDATSNGTIQQQGMAFVLRGIGLGDDAARMLADTTSDQTLEQSAATGGAALVARINALPEADRLKCCLMEVSLLRVNGGTRVMPRTAATQSWCSSLFDNTPTRSAASTMIADCNLQVVVNLVAHSGSTTEKTLTAMYGQDYSVRTAGYRPFPTMSTLDLSIPLRASTIVDCATPENILFGFNALIGNDPEQKDIGANLKSVLDGVFFRRHRHNHRFHLPFGTLVGASYNDGNGKRWLKIGKQQPTDRLASMRIADEKVRPPLFDWLVIEHDLKTKEFVNFMMPPWVAYNNGTLDFFIIPPMHGAEMSLYPEISAKLSGIRALSIGDVRFAKAKMESEKAKVAKKKEILTKPDGRTSTRKLKECELELIELAGEAAFNATLHKTIVVSYFRKDYPDWHLEGLVASEATRSLSHNARFDAAKRKRNEVVFLGNASKRAREAVVAERRLRPGGEDYKKAEASFEAAASATMN
jgi:hypothetical protein